MSNFKLTFVSNDGNAHTEDAALCKQLGYVTWTPSKLRIYLSASLSSGSAIELSQEVTKPVTIDHWKREDGTYAVGYEGFFKKYNQPRLVFYASPNLDDKINKVTLNDESLKLGYVDVYVGGQFQQKALYGGASPEEKDILITAKCEQESASIEAMIRVRRNANELTTKAKRDYIESLNAINHLLDQNNEIIDGTSGLGVYTTDFFKMHVKGSKSIAHGTEVFLPWHRLYTLDVERQLQKVNPDVSLHYWKFDEAAANIFKADFLGESVIDKDTSKEPVMISGVTLNFAKFNTDNPLKNWAIDREKLIRRKSWFDNGTEQAGNINENLEMEYVLSDPSVLEGKEYLRRNILNASDEIKADNKSFSSMEGNPHGVAHMSNGGFINYVPTAAKDPLFYFLHSNVERLYTQWQQTTFLKWQNGEDKAYNAYDANDVRVYENLTKSIKWKNKDAALWPWSGNVTPNEYQLLPVGTRANNFSKSYTAKNFKNPTVEDAIDAYGLKNIQNYLGYNYDDFNSKNIDGKSANGHNLLALKSTNEHSLLDSSENIIAKLKSLEGTNLLSSQESGTIGSSNEKPAQTLSTILNKITFNSIFSSDFEFNKPSLSINLLSALSTTDNIEYVDYIINNCVLNEIQEVIYQCEKSFELLKQDLSRKNIISYFDAKEGEMKEAEYSRYLNFYLLSLYGEDIISDADRVEVFKNNIAYLSDISNEEVVDVKITLYSFASNSTIKDKIIPLFFPIGKEEDLANYLKELEFLSQGKDSMSNKYWALHTLLTNAGVGK